MVNIGGMTVLTVCFQVSLILLIVPWRVLLSDLCTSHRSFAPSEMWVVLDTKAL